MIVKFKTYRAALLGAAGSAALFASPALAEPMLMVNTAASPNFGMGEMDSSTTTPEAFASSNFFGGIDDGGARARANTSYESSVSAFVNGSGEASSSATLTETVTNATAQTRDYFFTFQINRGSVTTDSNGSGTISTDEANAIFSADVSVDGSNIWSVGVEVGLANEIFSVLDDNSNDDGTLVGFDAFFSTDFVQASWSDSIFMIEIGQLASGDSLDLEYVLAGAVEATYSSFCSFEEEVDEGYGLCSFTNAGVSDPSVITSLGITSTVVPGAPTPPPPAGVAEPTSLALLGIGLAGLGLKRRRRFEL